MHRTHQPHRLSISGFTGRMGQTLARLAQEHNFTIVSALASELNAGQELQGIRVQSNPSIAIQSAEVVIDFSHYSFVPTLAQACYERKIPLVTGTTHLDDNAVRALEHASKVVPVLWAPNMSLGVELLAEIVEQATRRLGLGFDVEIIETHHNKKIDAPSGTAKRLVEAVRAGMDSLEPLVYGRQGDTGIRKPGEIGMHSLRGGDVIGNHTVMLLGHGETLEFTHRATSRDLFAHGALRAAHFIQNRAPGRYFLRDLIGKSVHL